MSRRSRKHASQTTSAAADQAAAAADGPAAAAARSSAAGNAVFFGVLLCFFLSGFAALIYQTAWLRQFSLIFGTSELAVAAVLAAYMGGLALGAALAARLIGRIHRPVLVYGLMEAGIALSALAVPWLLMAAGALYVAFLGGLSELPDAETLGQPLFYLLVAFVVLAIPTALMGATLPLLARYAVRSDVELGPKIAVLYATNTAGAVTGTLVAGFLLLPAVGLRTTVWSAVLVNAVVFALAVLLARAAPESDAESKADSAATPAAAFWSACVKPLFATAQSLRSRLTSIFRAQPVWMLPLMLASGAVAFLYEVLWTRMLSHVLGGSIYAFATMLAAFLAGIALGGGLVGRLARDKQAAARAFVLTQLAIALLSAAVYGWMQALVPETRNAAQFAVYAILVMLPATVFIGATFPLAVRVLAAGPFDAARATARIYSWNTLGAIVGAVGASFWLIPMLGFSGAIKLAVTLNLALALWAVVCVAAVPARVAAVLGAVCVLLAFAFQPGRPVSVLASTAFEIPTSETVREVYFGVGRSSTVLLNESDGFFDLRTNGLPEASILPRGAAGVGQTQQWLTALPLITRPEAESMLLVGFGGGVALEAAPSSLREIDVVELEPEVIEANRQLSGRRLQDPLEDDRVHIVFNDARNALRLSDKRYDIVVSQPSHPWTAGASHLFSREFFAVAKDHMRNGGVFLQWMSAGFVDEALLRSLSATLVDVFENVRLYQPAPSVLLFLASDAALDLERQLATSGRPIAADPLYFSYIRLNGVSDLVAALMLDEEGMRIFSSGAPLTTDDFNRMATDSRSLSDGLTAAELSRLLASYDPLLDGNGWVHTDLEASVDFTYVASRLLVDGQIDRASQLAGVVADRSTAAAISGLVRGLSGDLGGVRPAFLEALAANPDNQAARYALIQPALAELATGRADAATLQLSQGLSGSAAAVLEGWKLAGEEDWPALADIDARLAAAEATDLWYPDAARLRADWRTRVVGDSSYAADALRLIDRALAVQPNLDLLVLRAAAADALGDADAFRESTRYAAREISEQIEAIEAGSVLATRAELDGMFRQLRALRARMLQMSEGGEAAARLSDRIGLELERIQVLLR